GLRLAGEQAGLYGPEFGVSLSVASTICLLGALIWWNARSLNQLDAGRRLAQEDLGRHAADLELVNQELQTFAHSVSHDLRAPLRAIDGFTKAVMDHSAAALGAPQKADLERVRLAARRMGQIIDDLLALSRVTRAELRRAQCDLSALSFAVLA